ncbi:ABC transporter ATP-binding protein [Desulfobotulus sp.]|uniref:ABC transporter ATP-binding protein n=1 Tax=Desulfobotulus sp. TaxID=1940337 RepID=UPI002A363DF9|nr:ATP-binding cassette domain-containing protein [Desulfobotulus sp.]MDY0162454.1 ATP-binding cassette domain-containing protein [Desulfobotulus sp.]
MLDIQNLSQTFFPGTPNAVQALQGVSLHIEEESFTAIIGTNGSGKSTLLNAVAGTFLADQGKILLDGQDITRWPEHKRAALMGRVFQNPFAGTAAEMTLAENLVIAMRRGLKRPLSTALSRQVREEMAERVASLKMGLENRLDNPIGTLSGGQRQALTLLMATWLRPKLLLLDEHTAALDPKSAAQVADLTRRIIRSEKLTALMVTHSMQQSVELPDRIVMMHKGKIVEDYAGERKGRVRIPDLMAAFDRVRRRELFDASVAEVVAEQYV